MNFGRVGGLILYAILSRYARENCAQKTLADLLEDGHSQGCSKMQPCHEGI